MKSEAIRQNLTTEMNCPTLYTHKMEHSVGKKTHGTTLIITEHYVPISVCMCQKIFPKKITES